MKAAIRRIRQLLGLSLLSKRTQINILKRVLEHLNSNMCDSTSKGLCEFLSKYIREYDDSLYFYKNFPFFNFILKCIPLFTRKNALKFGADITNAYWWHLNKHGKIQRILFVEWMIKELKK